MKSYSFLKKYLLAATATAALLFSACDLDEHPTSFVGPKEYYKTRAQCLAGLNACYIPINSIYDYCFLIMTEGVTDLMYIASGTKDASSTYPPRSRSTARRYGPSATRASCTATRPSPPSNVRP